MPADADDSEVIIDGGGVGFQIGTLWAYLAVHDDQDEGVISMPTVIGHMPLIGADRTRVESLRPHAEKIARATRKQVRLVRFDNRTVEETLEP